MYVSRVENCSEQIQEFGFREEIENRDGDGMKLKGILYRVMVRVCVKYCMAASPLISA